MIEEIRANAPEYATHYKIGIMNNAMYYQYFEGVQFCYHYPSGKWRRSFACKENIKPLH